MKNLKFLGLVIFIIFKNILAQDLCSVSLIEENKILAENNFFRITFDTKGGKAIKIVFIPWELNITTKEGFFIDSFREIAGKERFEFGFLYPEYPYQYEILSSSGEEAKIRFSLKLGEIDPNYQNWVFQKEFTLKKNEPLIYLTIRFINEKGEEKKFAYRPSHLVDFENETVWYFVPDINGILIDYDPHIGSDGRGSHSLSTLYPSGSWIGCLAEKTKRGLIFDFEWKYLDSNEVWISSRKGSVVQWFYRKFNISKGNLWETNYIIFPVEGILTIDGTSSKIVGGITIGKNVNVGRPYSKEELKPENIVPVKLQLFSPFNRKIKYRIFEKIAGKSSRLIKEDELEIKGLSTKEIEFNWTVPKGDILAVLSAEIIENGKIVLTLERPIEIGRNIELYQAKLPVEKQIGESAGFIHAKPPVPDEVKKVDFSFVTPYENWAKPYYRGKTKLLFINRNHSLCHAREIYQRGDFEISILTTTPDKPYEQMKEIPRIIKNFSPDVMFFMAFDWKSGFTPGIIEIIKNWIYLGGGLIVDANLSNEIYLPLLEIIKEGKQVKPQDFLPNVPFKTIPLKLYEVGKGRVVIIEGGTIAKGDTLQLGDWRPNPWMPGWEFSYSYLIASILWACHREMSVNFKPATIEKDIVKVEIQTKEPTNKVKLIISIRNEYNETYSFNEKTIQLKEGKGIINVANLSEIQEGLSIYKILALNQKNQIVGWTSGKIEKSTNLKVELNLDSPTSAYFKNNEIKIKVNISPSEKIKEEVKGEIKIFDAWGRNIWKEEVKPGITILSPELKLQMDIWHEVILKVFKNGKIIAEKRQLLFILPEKIIPEDDFSVACWGHPYGGPFGYTLSPKSAVEYGIEYYYGYGEEIGRDQVFKNHGKIYGPVSIHSALFTSGRFKEKDPVTLITKPSLYPDKEEWKKVEKEVKTKTENYWKNLASCVMMLDDERDLKGDFDWSETTLSHFSEYLEKEYKTISNLNRIWGTNYKSFKEVKPERRENLKEDNLAPYIEFRKYIGWIIEEFFTRKPCEWVKEINPNITVGMHGIYTTSSSRPWDMSKIIPILSITGRYNGVLEEWFRGMGKNTIHGQYTGYDMGEKLTYENRITLWKNLFHGSRWILYYQMRNLIGAGGLFQSIINYDGTVRDVYRQLYKEELKEIKDGIGKLIINSKPLNDGIIFTYSYTSCLFNRYTSSYFAGKTLVEHLGYQHDLISYKDLEDKKLPSDTKIIFLTDCISMSNKEIEVIKEFVSSGGIVITDAQSGIYDEYGIKYKISPIDDVFGIDRSEIIYSPEKKKVNINSKDLNLWISEKGLKLKSAKPICKTEDGIPVIIVNSYGKGKAIYLNLYLPPYSKISGTGVAGEIVIEQPGEKEMVVGYQNVMKEVFENLCDIKPFIKIMPEFVAREVFVFSSSEDKTYTIGILPYPNQKEKIKIKISLPGYFNVFDVRGNKKIGSGNNIETFLIPEKVLLLSLLPYNVKSIKVNIPPVCYQGDIVNVSGKIITEKDIPDGHILNVKVISPDKKEIKFWSFNVKATGSEFNFLLPVALNMKPGSYTIIVKDIMTGKKGTYNFKINKR